MTAQDASAIPVMHVVDLSDGNDRLFGKAKMILWLMREQRRSGKVAPRLATLCPCELANVVRADGFEVDVLDLRVKTFPFGALGRLSALLRAAGGPVLHTHGYKPNIIGRLIRGFGTPMRKLISTCHGFVDDPFTLRVYNAADRWTGFASDIVTAPDEHMLERFPRFVRTAFIPNAIPDRAVATPAQRTAARARYEFADGAFVAGELGRFSSEKGVVNFVGAARLTIGTNLVWAAAGAGELEHVLHDPAVPSLKAVGYVTPEEYLGALDAYVQPSFTEGLALSLLEAMRAGLPIVATRVGATETAIRHEVEGLLVQPDPGQIAAAVERLRLDPALAAALGRAARSRFEQMFRITAMHDRYYELYVKA
jgi:glycosyltransferase involved in cell wall biosynthesis